MTRYQYYQSNTPCTWDDSFKNLDYQYRPHKDHDMVQQWHDQGYSENLTLNGSAHNLEGTIPKYIQPLCNKLGWRDIGCALYQMNCGNIIPVHRDHYTVYKKIIGIRPDQIWRAVVFLEDWKSGHYFEINSKPITQWSAGDYVVWNNDVPHMAANVGVEPRYTLQITGWI